MTDTLDHPHLAMLQEAYGHGTDPVVDLQWPDALPRGSAAMEKRGPWMRDYLHPQIADLLAKLLQYGPMALGARGGAGAAALEHQAPNPAVMDRMRQGHFDRTNDSSMWLATQPVRFPSAEYTARGNLEMPDNMNVRGAPRDMLLDRLDLAPGVRSTADMLRNMRPRDTGAEPANSNPPADHKPLPAGDYTMDQLPPSYRNAFDLMNLIEDAVRRNPKLLSEPPPNLTLLPGGKKD